MTAKERLDLLTQVFQTVSRFTIPVGESVDIAEKVIMPLRYLIEEEVQNVNSELKGEPDDSNGRIDAASVAGNDK